MDTQPVHRSVIYAVGTAMGARFVSQFRYKSKRAKSLKDLGVRGWLLVWLACLSFGCVSAMGLVLVAWIVSGKSIRFPAVPNSMLGLVLSPEEQHVAAAKRMIDADEQIEKFFAQHPDLQSARQSLPELRARIERTSDAMEAWSALFSSGPIDWKVKKRLDEYCATRGYPTGRSLVFHFNRPNYFGLQSDIDKELGRYLHSSFKLGVNYTPAPITPMGQSPSMGNPFPR